MDSLFCQVTWLIFRCPPHSLQCMYRYYFFEGELLARLQDELDLAYMFITHDLATVRAIADEVVVMKEGIVVEAGPKDEMFRPPHHPYTDLLLSSVPEMDPDWLTNLLEERGVDNIGDAATGRA